MKEEEDKKINILKKKKKKEGGKILSFPVQFVDFCCVTRVKAQKRKEH